MSVSRIRTASFYFVGLQDSCVAVDRVLELEVGVATALSFIGSSESMPSPTVSLLAAGVCSKSPNWLRGLSSCLIHRVWILVFVWSNGIFERSSVTQRTNNGKNDWQKNETMRYSNGDNSEKGHKYGIENLIRGKE